jgi:diaminopimelate decarboxylase
VSDVLELFPPGAGVDTDGELVVGRCRLRDLAAEFGTTAYVVDEGALRERAREYRDELRARWPESLAVFASKACPSTAVLRAVAEEGLGCDVAGAGELVHALAAGVDPARIYLHGNAKTDDDLRRALDAGVGTVAVDNLDDVDRLQRLARGEQGVLVRVIPGVRPDTHAAVATGQEDSKFGLAPADARAAIERLRGSDRLRLDGCTSTSARRSSPPRRSGGRSRRWRRSAVYDLGGGLGARYTYADRPPSVAEYLDVLVGAARLVGRHCESGDVLSAGVALREPRVGDLVAVPATGAYCFTMRNGYNGALRPPMVFVRDGEARAVVHRERYDDLLRLDA